MWILQQVIILLTVANFIEGQSPTENTECGSMRTAAGHLKNAIKIALSKDVQCGRNQPCTGVKCSWSGGGVLEVDLNHCQHPVNYHVLFTYPALKINETLKLAQGDEKTLYKQLVTVKIKVTKLERKESIVTTTVLLEVCLSPNLCRQYSIMDNQKFCVMMQHCPGYNESAHQYTPCDAKPSSAVPPSDGTYNPHKGGDGDDKKGLSTAAIIGICAAAACAILIVVGVVVYWKKYHHRSRLRAAYYNDISMHDPLYEDFGPEVA